MLKSFMIKAKHPFTIIVVSIAVFLFALFVLFLFVICVEGAHWVYVPLVGVDCGRSRQTLVDAMVDSIVFICVILFLFLQVIRTKSSLRFSSTID